MPHTPSAEPTCDNGGDVFGRVRGVRVHQTCVGVEIIIYVSATLGSDRGGDFVISRSDLVGVKIDSSGNIRSLLHARLDKLSAAVGDIGILADHDIIVGLNDATRLF